VGVVNKSGINVTKEWSRGNRRYWEEPVISAQATVSIYPVPLPPEFA
jgi:hypothetical protein